MEADGIHPSEAAEVKACGVAHPRSQRFPPTLRLRAHHEFLAVQRKGRRYTVPHFVVIACRTDKAPSRLGITTSKKVGSAPARNRVRRLVREFFRRCGPQEPPRDTVVIARAGAAQLSYAEVADELGSAFAKIQAWLDQEAQSEGNESPAFGFSGGGTGKQS